MRSCSIVPIGMTRYREGLAPVESFDAADCAEIIRQVDEWTEAFYREHGERIVYLSDEFYLRAGLPVPAAGYYGDFPQLENGVGMVRTFMDSFIEEAEYAGSMEEKVSADLATGEAMYPVMCDVIAKANEILGGKLDITIHKIICDFVPDASGSGKSRFYPNKDILLNSVKRWNKDSLVFCGIIHSHPKNGSCRLSVADENYAAKFLELNPDFKDVYFPIFFMVNLYVYSVSRSERAEILICEEDLIVVEDQQI